MNKQIVSIMKRIITKNVKYNHFMKFKYKENNYNKNTFSLNLRMCILKKYLDVEIYRFCGVVL